MNLSLDETQEDLSGLAAQIAARHGDPAHVEQVEATDDVFDRELWRALADAGLLGAGVPEQHGGLGLGAVGLGLLCEEIGRVVAPTPVVPTGAAAVVLARCASREQQQRWLPGVLAGTTVIAVAPPQSVAELNRDGSRVSGRLVGVPWAHVADVVLVVHGEALLAVDLSASGVTGTRATTTARDVAMTMTLDGASAEEVGGADAAPLLRDVWRTALANTQAGVTDAALRLTASYTSAREQFGKPLSTFQAVALKAADGYLDTTAIRAVARQAAWTIDQGLDPTLAVLTAAWWAAEGGQHCVHLTQHLHGGMGADVTYPVHRYFLWGKQIELLLGGASAILAELGDALANRPEAGDCLSL